MKSVNFFIDKAREYTNSIDGILPNLPPQDSPGMVTSTGYKDLSEKISDIRNKTKLLFSEFDNGDIFEKNIAAIDENKMLLSEEEEVLERYKYTLSLFIDHATEFSKRAN
jgi:hypothetical protein